MLRIALEKDLEKLAKIYKNTVQKLAIELYTPEQVTAWSQAPDNREFFSKFILEATTYIWEKEGKILGFCGLKKDGHIASLYVSPEYTRQGIGTKLVKNAIAEGQKLSVTRFYTEASYLSKTVFERCGFKVYDEEYVKYGDVEFHRYKMEKFTEF